MKKQAMQSKKKKSRDRGLLLEKSSAVKETEKNVVWLHTPAL